MDSSGRRVISSSVMFVLLFIALLSGVSGTRGGASSAESVHVLASGISIDLSGSMGAAEYQSKSDISTNTSSRHGESGHAEAISDLHDQLENESDLLKSCVRSSATENERSSKIDFTSMLGAKLDNPVVREIASLVRRFKRSTLDDADKLKKYRMPIHDALVDMLKAGWDTMTTRIKQRNDFFPGTKAHYNFVAAAVHMNQIRRLGTDILAVAVEDWLSMKVSPCIVTLHDAKAKPIWGEEGSILDDSLELSMKIEIRWTATAGELAQLYPDNSLASIALWAAFSAAALLPSTKAVLKLGLKLISDPGKMCKGCEGFADTGYLTLLPKHTSFEPWDYDSLSNEIEKYLNGWVQSIITKIWTRRQSEADLVLIPLHWCLGLEGGGQNLGLRLVGFRIRQIEGDDDEYGSYALAVLSLSPVPSPFVEYYDFTSEGVRFGGVDTRFTGERPYRQDIEGLLQEMYKQVHEAQAAHPGSFIVFLEDGLWERNLLPLVRDKAKDSSVKDFLLKWGFMGEKTVQRVVKKFQGAWIKGGLASLYLGQNWNVLSHLLFNFYATDHEYTKKGQCKHNTEGILESECPEVVPSLALNWYRKCRVLGKFFAVRGDDLDTVLDAFDIYLAASEALLLNWISDDPARTSMELVRDARCMKTYNGIEPPGSGEYDVLRARPIQNDEVDAMFAIEDLKVFFVSPEEYNSLFTVKRGKVFFGRPGKYGSLANVVPLRDEELLLGPEVAVVVRLLNKGDLVIADGFCALHSLDGAAPYILLYRIDTKATAYKLLGLKETKDEKFLRCAAQKAAIEMDALKRRAAQEDRETMRVWLQDNRFSGTDVDEQRTGGSKMGSISGDKKYPLHVAVKDKNPEMVRILLANGASSRNEDDRKRTPLALAKYYRSNMGKRGHYKADEEELLTQIIDLLSPSEYKS